MTDDAHVEPRRRAARGDRDFVGLAMGQGRASLERRAALITAVARWQNKVF